MRRIGHVPGNRSRRTALSFGERRIGVGGRGARISATFADSPESNVGKERKIPPKCRRCVTSCSLVFRQFFFTLSKLSLTCTKLSSLWPSTAVCSPPRNDHQCTLSLQETKDAVTEYCVHTGGKMIELADQAEDKVIDMRMREIEDASFQENHDRNSEFSVSGVSLARGMVF